MLCSSQTTRRNSMVMWQRRSPVTHLNQEERMLTKGCMWIVIMLERSGCVDCNLASLLSWTLCWFSGSPSNKPQSKCQSSELSLWQWKLRWSCWGDYDTCCTWWALRSLVPHTFIATIWWLFTTHSDLNPCSRRRATQFTITIMQSRSGSPWVSCSQDILGQMRTLVILQQKFCMVRNDGIWSHNSCMISMMSKCGCNFSTNSW